MSLSSAVYTFTEKTTVGTLPSIMTITHFRILNETTFKDLRVVGRHNSMRMVWATAVVRLSLTATIRLIQLRLLKTRNSGWRILSASRDTSVINPMAWYPLGVRRGMSPRRRDDALHEPRDKNNTTNQSNVISADDSAYTSLTCDNSS